MEQVIAVAATAADETPFYVRADGNDVFAVLTEPVSAPEGVAAILLAGGAFVGGTNRNRSCVRIARALAARGRHAVRLDYRGVGESGGEIDTYSLREPFTAEVIATMAALREQGVDRFVLVGTSCFGSRTALAAAAESPAAVVGVALFATPIKDTPPDGELAAPPLARLVRRAASPRELRRLLDPRLRRRYVELARVKLRRALRPSRYGERGCSDRFYRPLATVVAEGMPVLFAYGETDESYAGFQAARRGRLGRLLERAGAQVEIRTLPGSVHGVRRVREQDRVVALAVEWISSVGAARGEQAADGAE
jgi:pimeloyl-ACP methyl ester carboxylesterase